MSGEAGKGDKRRNGTGYSDGWDRIFRKPATACEQCPQEALKYTGTARYSVPPQFEFKCDICGTSHWTLDCPHKNTVAVEGEFVKLHCKDCGMHKNIFGEWYALTRKINPPYNWLTDGKDEK